MSFLYDTEQEIEDIVRGFETCTMPGDDFHHREHLVVAVYYLQTLSPGDAVARMRAALLRFLAHHGEDIQKYSEEVTVFWIDQVATRLESISADVTLADKCNLVIGALVGVNSPTHTPASPVEGEE
ncbi:MAG: hypothetical protein ABR594_00100 [Pyrinomonadaceae bacterium]